MSKRKKKGHTYEYIKSDLYRYYGEVTFIKFIKALFGNKSFQYQFWMRLCQMGGVYKLVAKPFYKMKQKGNIQIDYRTKIGYGLYIDYI